MKLAMKINQDIKLYTSYPLTIECILDKLVYEVTINLKNRHYGTVLRYKQLLEITKNKDIKEIFNTLRKLTKGE